MAVDTPARVIVVGAGPIGLEAALYARFLGYEVEVFEQGEVGHHVRRWAHVRMHTPFCRSSSPLGLAALKAQDPHYREPEAADHLVGGAWWDRYVVPLSQTDLLVDSLRLGMRVVAMANRDFRKTERVDDELRAEAPLRVVVEDTAGRELEATADVVIDASGVLGQPNWLGQGGAPAAGEMRYRGRIEYGIPDVAGAERPRFAGKRVLLVGSGFDAAITLSGLCSLVDQEPGTRITWVTQQASAAPDEALRAMSADDRLTEWARTIASAAEGAAKRPASIVRRDDGTVTAVDFDATADRWSVRFGGGNGEVQQFDRIIACVGHHPDHALYRELQVETDGVWDRPLGSAEREAAEGESSVPGASAEALRHREPNFYVLGAKSWGRRPGFVYAHGLQQIRALFSLIGDRAELDLYASMQRSLE